MPPVSVPPAGLVVTPAAVHSAEAIALLRGYFTDIVDRYHQHHHSRGALPGEVDTALADAPSDDLLAFLILRRCGDPVGCVGLRRLSADVLELKRMYVTAAARGLGGARLLLAAAEQTAVGLGARAIRLETRHDLVEARALYAAVGYVEIPHYATGPYVDHSFEKALVTAVS